MNNIENIYFVDFERKANFDPAKAPIIRANKAKNSTFIGLTSKLIPGIVGNEMLLVFKFLSKIIRKAAIMNRRMKLFTIKIDFNGRTVDFVTINKVAMRAPTKIAKGTM